MKKKLLSLISLILALFILAGCAGGGDPIDTQSTTEDTTAAIEGPILNGVSLSEYTIIYSEENGEYDKRAANYIKQSIKEITNVDIQVKKDSSKYTTENEIIVGECDRELSRALDADAKHSQFSILADDKSIAIEADYFVIAAAAYYFVETYITADIFNNTVPQKVLVCDPIVKDAKNFIFLIGDGMGKYQTLLFDYTDIPEADVYSDKEDIFYGYLLPAEGQARTPSLSGVTDSAAAATALASGYKTINRYIGMDKNKNDVQSLTELAASKGMSTAIMSTDAQTGATPAGFSAHVDDRGLSAEIQKDQRTLISKQKTKISCGHNVYTNEGVTSLVQNVSTMINDLDDNENGFFLMYEEGHIDKHSHSNDMENTFLALLRFNQVIAKVMEYAYYNPETFVIITADHETGDLRPEKTGELAFHSENHSSATVPVFAFGQHSNLFNNKQIENIQIPKTIAKMWGVDDFGDTTKAGSLLK